MVDLAKAARLKKVRNFLGYSQQKMAEELQVTNGAIAHWESGDRPIPGPVLKLIELYERSMHSELLNPLPLNEEALTASREFLKIAMQALQDEGFSVEQAAKDRIYKLALNYFSEAFNKDQIFAKVRLAFLRRLISTFSGSQGLSLKAAQMACFIEAGLPPELPVLLGDIESAGKALPFSQIEKILKASYEAPLNTLFSKISNAPMSVTSLAQLHRATLVSGENVVIKVQVPGISAVLESQFKKLSFLKTLDALFRKTSTDVFEDIKKQILFELNYEREIKNQERFRNIFEHQPGIVIPKIYKNLCSKNIIVSQFEPGFSFATFGARASADKKSQAAFLISYFYGFSIFQRHVAQADLHPGNFLFRDNEVVFLDFGRVIEYEPAEIELERTLYLAILYKNKAKVFEELQKRDLLVGADSFDFDEFWQILMKQQEHLLTNAPFKITRSLVRSVNLEASLFRDRKRIKLDKSLLRASIVNVSLLSLFAELEAEAPWREQTLAILEAKA